MFRLTVVLAALLLTLAAPADLVVLTRAVGVDEVALGEGAYGTAYVRAKKRTLAVDPAILLTPFREAAGLPLKAGRSNDIVENRPETVGRALGYYLSAMSTLYGITKDEDLHDRICYVVEELYGCSLKNRSLLPIHEAQAFNGTTFDFPPHTAHAVLAGLHDAFRATGNRRAFDLIVQWVDWYQKCWAEKMEKEAREKWLAGDWGGLNRVYLYVYNEFGRNNYLHDGWETFNQRPYFDELRKGNGDFTREPPKALAAKMCGIYMRHRRSNWGELHKAAASYLDHARKTGDYGADDAGATVDLVWLAARLNEEIPDGRLGDFIADRTARLFRNAHASSLVDIADVFALKARENVYATSPGTLWVNQYVMSRVTWSVRGLSLTMRPVSEGTASFDLKVRAKTSETFTLMLRQQKGRTPQVTLNGNRLAVAADANGYVAVRRTWAPDDTLRVSF